MPVSHNEVAHAEALTHLGQADVRLAEVVARIGPCRLAYYEPDFNALCRSIVFQQLSGKAAGTIMGRVLQAAGQGGKVSPRKVLALGAEGLRPLGVSQQKASYLLDLAERSQRKQIPWARLAEMPDEAVVEVLTAVKGVGVWTAQMFLIFALRRPDVLPVGDLGIQTGMQRLYALEARPKAAQMEELAAPWRPYRSIACWYLWRTLDGEAAL